MNGYFFRLAHQTGLKIGAADSPRAISPNSPPIAGSSTPTADLIEENIETESSTALDPPLPFGTSDAPLGGATEGQSEFAATSENLPLPPTGLEIPLAPSSVSPPIRDNAPRETETARESASSLELATSSIANPARLPSPPSARAPAINEIVDNVMEWIRDSEDPAAPRSPESNPLTNPIPSTTSPVEVAAVVSPERSDERPAPLPAKQVLSSSISEKDLRLRPAAFSPSVTERESQPWSVHIGAIHLTIEAPPEKSGPPAVETPRTSAPQSQTAPGTTSSRLRRHYLRLC